MNGQRRLDFERGLAALPQDLRIGPVGKNGETLNFDEAEVWKRVLAWRVANWMQPSSILETHKGLGMSARVYQHAAPQSLIYSCSDFVQDLGAVADNSVDLLDIDPFGQPYIALKLALPKLKKSGNVVLFITNGEMMAVCRGLTKSQFLKTTYKGLGALSWPAETYIPYLVKQTELTYRFDYAFPTTSRVILTRGPLPTCVYKDCPKQMSWLKREPGFFVR